MITNDSEYRKNVRIAWEKFIREEEFDFSFVRPEIYASWLRSRAAKVDPLHMKTSILDQKEITQKLKQNKLLIDTVRPYMEKLYSIVQGSGFYLLLCDKDGYVLDLIGDPDIIARGSHESMLVIGANRNENFAGTNAIGTALAIRNPIQIWAAEHYMEPHQKYTCSCAPIFDIKGDILGCLNLTGQAENTHVHTLGMVISAADGISKELQIRKAYEEIENISAQRNRIIESVDSGLILLDSDHTIVQINSKALQMIGQERESTIGSNISNVCSINEPSFGKESLAYLTKEMSRREVNLFIQDAHKPPNKFNLSISFIGNTSTSQMGVVMRLDEAKRINEMVSRISGYKSTFTFDSLVGSSVEMNNLIQVSKRAALSCANVLILGESGTGKELIAQAIHNASQYTNGPFVAINCGALPRGLIESELFGYERGAFTGASKDGKPGKFELADGGTIFLDEIGDMPFDVQVSLLRVLQTREVIRIGGTHPIKISVRVIAATNRTLQEAIEAKTFRQDLYYRLNVLRIQIPPLRERVGDICELADNFVRSYQSFQGIQMHIAPEVYTILCQYNWPGNVRELENIIERAVNIADGSIILPEHLPENIRQSHTSNSYCSADLVHVDNADTQARTLKASEHQLILSALDQTNGNIKKTAELLGIGRRTMYRKMDKYGINHHDLPTS